MTFSFILKRMLQQWRIMLMLLIAMCLMTAFFALGPLYLRYTNQVLLTYLFQHRQIHEDSIVLSSDATFGTIEDRIIDSELGSLLLYTRNFRRSSYDGNVSATNLTCGTQVDQCNQLFTFEDYFAELVTLVEGRLPQPRQTGDASQFVEVAITKTVAEKAGLQIGSEYHMANFGFRLDVVIVGIVEINDANDYFWVGNRLFVTGATILREFRPARYDWGMVIHPDEYRSAYQVSEYISFVKFLKLDLTKITAANVDAAREAIDIVPVRIQNARPESVQVVNGPSRLLTRHATQLESSEGMIIFLSTGLLFLMLYNLLATGQMVLQTQAHEWAMLRSRGGGIRQLVQMQFLPAAILGLIAGATAIIFSRALLAAVAYVGPYGDIIESRDTIWEIDMPETSYRLAALAALGCVLIVTYPAARTARLNSLAQKQQVSRPILKPRWAVLFMDVGLFALGLMFMLRLYWTIGGDFSHLLQNVVAAPGEIIETVRQNLRNTDQLKDPFNMAAPVFLLAGGALFWLRIFPLMMRAISAGANRLSRLGIPLAVWNVERNTAHYGQFVLVLIGTMAVGTASVSLQHTQKIGAWQVARQETGGDIRLDLAVGEADVLAAAWNEPDEVQNSAALMVTGFRANNVSTMETVYIIGVDNQEFARAFPDLAPGIEDLHALAPVGLPLPSTAQQLLVPIWSESIATERYPEPKVALNAYLIDALGFPYVVNLTQTAQSVTTPPAEWVELSGDMPTTGQPPYHFWRLGIATEQRDRRFFDHTIYLGQWETVDADGTTTAINTYATDEQWVSSASIYPFIGPWTMLDPEHEFIKETSPELVDWEGVTALKVGYEGERAFSANRIYEPSVTINAPLMGPVPVIISPEFTRVFRGTGEDLPNAKIAPLQVGDVRAVSFNVGLRGNLLFELEVAGIVDQFPTFGATAQDIYMIAPLGSMRFLFNQRFRDEADLIDVNQVWINLKEQAEPSAALRQNIEALPGVTDTTYAWTRYGEILREPIPNTIAGMFFAAFWISLALSLVNFAFYMIITAQQRSFSFGVLRSIGWNLNHIWRLLFFEQLVLIIPATLIGTLLGIGLAYLLLPFIALSGTLALRLPTLQLSGIVLILVVGFVVLLTFIGLWLRRMSLQQIMRLGEE